MMSQSYMNIYFGRVMSVENRNSPEKSLPEILSPDISSHAQNISQHTNDVETIRSKPTYAEIVKQVKRE